jgi:hypothetical protein
MTTQPTANNNIPADDWRLHDGDTGADLGAATPAQIVASLADEPYGIILVDADGDVVSPGTWAAQQPGVRSVYVTAR